MKQSFLFFTLLFCTVVAWAQTDDASRYASIITEENLKKHLTIIAGEEMEGRETGTDGQRRAATYIEDQFKKMGLQPPAVLNGYQQWYPLFIDSITGCKVKVGKLTLKDNIDFYCRNISNSSKKITAQKIVFAGYGISQGGYDDYKGLDVNGKVVVFFVGEPANTGDYILSSEGRAVKYRYTKFTEKLAIAKKKGAAAILIINPLMETFDSTLLQLNRKADMFFPRSGDDNAPNYIFLSHKAAKKVFAKWPVTKMIADANASLQFTHKEYPELSTAVSFDYKKERKEINASNIIGVIEGTDKKEEYVFVTAHYDHIGKHNGKIYYGADDDGSGTCAVLQMAEAFAKAKAEGKGPRRTIVFMTVSGEEKGLWGSEYYADHPAFPLDKTSVDLNIDMVGRIDPERKTADTSNYVYVIGHDKLSTDLPGISEAVNNKYIQLVLDYKFDDPNDDERIYYRSDHYNFAKKGVPILFFYDGMLQGDYHKPTDTIDKINWGLYAKRTQLIFYTAWEIANRDDMLKRDLPVPEGTR